MTTPMLDGRTVEDILVQIKQKSEFYTPEWLMDTDNADGGTALARLFAEMFHGTVDRYNRFPDKCYLEFLNMIGVCAKSVSPATGMAAAELVDGAGQNVYIKKGTQLFTDIADGESGDRRIVFETCSGFFATPAQMTAIFMTAPKHDVITATQLSEEGSLPLTLFAPDSSANLERHAFAVAHQAVLELTGGAEISVRLTNSAMPFRDSQLMRQLCDPDFAEWSYISAGGRKRLDARFCEEHILLTKGAGALISTDEGGGRSEDAELLNWIFCDMKRSEGCSEIAVDGISVSSRSLDSAETGRGIAPRHIFINDNELDTAECGYCFGREPAVYDALYIDCAEAFSKSGAEITLELSVSTVILNDDGLAGEVGQEFNNKLLVDKEDTKASPPDDIYISDIRWEYWNGYGWARLDVSGALNPFSCRDGGGRKTVRFTCPADFSASVQNAYEGLWLRVRVCEVENKFSTRGRWLVPWLKSVDIRFDYGGAYLPAQAISVTNVCETLRFEPDGSPADMRLFSLMPDRNNSVYFLFDEAPSGYPVNFYFELTASDGGARELSYEYLAAEHGGRSVWRELKTEDRTQGLTRSGILSLYAPSDFAEARLFGRSGFWIRAVELSAGGGCPRLCGIRKNAVEIVQRESVTDERHEFVAGRIWQELALANSPVISCELWVNELGETPVSELNELRNCDSGSVRMVTDDDGQLTECWVRWQPRVSLADSGGGDRHFLLDYGRGAIRFGDGVNGRIPSYTANAAISVDYSFGGGSDGNLPPQAIDGLIVGIPFVESMTNFEPTCGGSNGQSLEAIRSIGARRLKHRGRAVTAEDCEILVMEEFTEVEEVRCFGGRNRFGDIENGCVTVVVKPRELGSSTYPAALCRRIEDYLAGCACCEPAAGGRFAVIPARVMRVSAEVSIQLDSYEYAAQTERAVINAINGLICRPTGKSIGVMPSVSGIYAALKGAEHISYVSRVLLTGEYYDKGERVTVPLDGTDVYRYFIASAGTHTVRI